MSLLDKCISYQGYWPDGLLTPPSEEALKWDLEQSKNLGFNLVRKHIKAGFSTLIGSAPTILVSHWLRAS